MKLLVYSSDATRSQEKEFSRIPSFEGRKGIKALKDAIVAYQANLRQGNACTKTRAEVSGSGKKPYRQKGTGMARHGEKRSPIWSGGGVVFGPKPRDYTKKINKEVKILALRRALFDRAAEQKVCLMESVTVSEPKTKQFSAILERIYGRGKVLLVDEKFEDNIILATRNIERLFVTDADSLNAWDLVRYEKIIFSEKAFDRILTRMHA